NKQGTTTTDQNGNPIYNPGPAEDTNKPNEGYLPTPESSHQTPPPVASPGPPAGQVIEQAGVGGTTGYGRAGVLELGGPAGFTAASDFKQANVTPSIGWFIADNLEVSGLLGLNYISANSQDATMFSAMVEPSYHLPFTRTAFGFLGLGMGGSHL